MGWLLLGLALGAAGAWLARGRELRAALGAADARRAAEQAALQNVFKALARAALDDYRRGGEADLEKRRFAVKEAISPVQETLGRLEGQLAELERARVGAYAALREQVRALSDGQVLLRREAGNLARALRAPAVRGRWGEIQLRRVVEMAGMDKHCDFVEQPTVETEAGRLRPDLVVMLPGGKQVVVDAKAPLAAYLEAVDAEDDAARQARLKDHARSIREHMAALARKSYFEDLPSSPEFVVMFLPGESFFSAALEHDPDLIEAGIAQNVILATPTTLVALLRTVAYGWRQQGVTENAKAIHELGRELHERLGSLFGHFSNLGKQLEGSVEAYNRALGALESRVLVSARRLRDLGVSRVGEELAAMEPLEVTPRKVEGAALPSASGAEEDLGGEAGALPPAESWPKA
ncbi:MAG TPA: DNA recombination protein RmuC [Anaeromyxobacteraceae bacterium]|nr:DNA recombination protein RmuC [Anaeromyxobacteraceae bacterium]